MWRNGDFMQNTVAPAHQWNLNHLVAFRAVAESLSFSVAAQQLAVPRSTVSRAVRALEDALGVRLLQRTTRQVILTAAGAALLAGVTQPLNALASVGRELPQEAQQLAGTLRITATSDLASGMLAAVLAAFSRRHPGIRLDVRPTMRVVDLVTEQVDVAFRLSAGPLRDSTLLAQRLGSVNLALYAAPSWLALHTMPRRPHDLDGSHWVLFRAQGRRLRLNGPGGVFQVPTSPLVGSDDVTFLRQMVLAGSGVGCMPEFMTEEDVAQGRLVAVFPRWSASITLWMLSPGGRHPPARVQALRSFVTGPAGRAMLPRTLRQGGPSPRARAQKVRS